LENNSLSLLLSLGSNIEPREMYLTKALKELQKYFALQALSSLYETAPQDDLEQNNFLNLCVFFITKISDPYEVLNIIKEIEKRLGRTKELNRPKGPRIIDIDIILMGDIKIKSESLNIPHPVFLKRNFVLIPLWELLGKENFKKNDFGIKLVVGQIKKAIQKNSKQIVINKGFIKI
jgi:2-amino-4-hydroxy-6-hydroxymethyldihydropteridine diphosphokinase